jgi:hypothetical protein
MRIKAFIQETKEAAWKNTKKKWTTELKTTTDWLKDAQKVFNFYIRNPRRGQTVYFLQPTTKEKERGPLLQPRRTFKRKV